MIAAQPLLTQPRLSDTNLVLGALNPLVIGGVRDSSPNGNDGTLSGTPVFERGGGIALDGVGDKVDFGDIGDIQEVSFWVKPVSTTEQLVLVDTGDYVHLVAGTITYVGLTEVATYVNGEPSTALAGGEWSHVVCQFESDDANNFELEHDHVLGLDHDHNHAHGPG